MEYHPNITPLLAYPILVPDDVLIIIISTYVDKKIEKIINELFNFNLFKFI